MNHLAEPLPQVNLLAKIPADRTESAPILGQQAAVWPPLLPFGGLAAAREAAGLLLPVC